MTEFVVIVGLALLGITLIEVAAVAYRARRRTVVVRRTAAQRLEAFRERAFFALTKTRPEDTPIVGGWRGMRKFYVARKVEEAADICSFYLKPYDGKTVPLFVPGRHLTLQVSVPDRPQPLMRCYSISNAPLTSDHYRITIKKLHPPAEDASAPAGVVSGYFHDEIPIGATLNVRAPSGSFFFDFTDQRPAVLIAGGVGVTPLVSMLSAIAAFQRPREVWFFYGVRNSRDHAFRSEIEAAAAQHGNIRLIICYSQPSETCVKGRDYSYHGRITVPLLRSVLPHIGYVFYVCGPSGMMQGLVGRLTAWGVPEENIRTEAFGATTVKAQPAAQSAAEDAAEAGLPVVFARSGMRAQWNSEAKVLLDLVQDSGINLQTGCRAGQCGSCMVAVSEGRVRHMVQPGLPLAEGYCLPCVAVPETELVLDI